MDCVRVSEREVSGEVWDADYKRLSDVNSKEACRQACVSDLDCVAWKYGGGECSVADSIRGSYPHLLIGRSLVSDSGIGSIAMASGLIACENTYSMLKTLGMVFLIGVILVGVWYLLRCKSKSR